MAKKLRGEDRYPATVDGSIELIEFVCREVNDAADARRSGSYPRDKYPRGWKNRLNGIWWDAARQRSISLPDELAVQRKPLLSVFECELTVENVEVFATLLTRLVGQLHKAWEDIKLEQYLAQDSCNPELRTDEEITAVASDSAARTVVPIPPDGSNMETGEHGSPPASSTDSLPDENGYVKHPVDPTAYVPKTQILAEEAPEGFPLTNKLLTKILRDFKANGVPWTRPIKNDGTPNRQRCSVHLVLWKQYVERQLHPPVEQGIQVDECDLPALTPEYIEEVGQRAAEIRRARPGK